MKIFVFGDSFAAHPNGWVSMLQGDITNFAENGIGEYKIYKKVLSNLGFEKAIVCHTSPWRVHTRVHPIHKYDKIRPNNDFLLNDVEYHSKINNDMSVVNEYLKKYYDPNYQLDTYHLFVKEILSMEHTLNITFHDKDDTVKIKNNFNHVWKEHPGNINHMSEHGNRLVAELVGKLL